VYNLPHFKANSEEEVHAFMNAYPFVLVCGVDENGLPVATQVPVLLVFRNGGLLLQGHILRNTDHHRAFEKNKNVLVVFTGAHAYVSAKWYPQQNTASTWNYQSVHARGVMHFKDQPWLIDLLARLTAQFENDADSPSLLHQMETDYLQQHTRAIVGFEVEVTSLEHAFKLSQNKDEVTRQRIIEGLNEKGDADSMLMAAAMKRFYKL
jgi:transcriptional regulator